AVPARALECHAVPLAADGAVGDARAAAGPVDRDEHLDPILVGAFQEQMFDAAKIAGAFFADVADEEDVARGLNPGFVHRANDREQHRKRARVVADAWSRETRARP